MSEQSLRYPLPIGLVTRAAGALLLGRRRAFRPDARREIASLRIPLLVTGRDHIPAAGPCLVTVNHYVRPGYMAWWTSFAISAQLPAEPHWMMTRELSFPGQKRDLVLRPLTRLGIIWFCRVYGFTRMPPMPPNPAEAAERAQAIRHLFTFIRQKGDGWIGLAPEGRGWPGSCLGWPPAGAGRLMMQLAREGFAILPAGVYEAGGALHLHFGPVYHLGPLPDLPKSELDHEASRQVMEHIACLLPTGLRGEF